MTPQRLGPSLDGSLYRVERTPDSATDAQAGLLTVCEHGDSAAALRRMEHALAMRAHLDAGFAAVPQQLTQYEGRPALWHGDPGGWPLQLAAGQPLAPAKALALAIAIAGALAPLHARRIVHQSLRPENLLVDAAGRVFLTGFERASHATRSRGADGDALGARAALPYIAPEQTGRVQRSIDTRTDLYALGVILYQMVCGELPFEAGNAAEWAHCHIAWSPIAPALRHAPVPQALSQIILRLLAKSADERYQTAAGLEADLRRCAHGLGRAQDIAPFTLGAHDRPDRLVLPERLFGRDRTLAQMLEQFQRVAAQGRSELLLIAGYSGVGKSALVGEFRSAVSAQRALFAGGKFEQHRGDIPYSMFAQALRQLVRELLTLDDQALAVWRQRLGAALGGNAQALTHLVPELEHIIGRQPALKEVPVAESTLRFQLTVQKFLSAFSSEKQPLVLFLDDIQWIDAASLELLAALLANPQLRHVLLIGAYRSNEVGAGHALDARIAQIRAARTPLQQIELQALTLDELTQLVCRSLHDDAPYVAELARLVWRKTRGNPLFSKQLLQEIAEQGLLRFDRAAQRWQWDLAAIEALDYSQNVAELVAQKIQRQPPPARALLTLLACLGVRASGETLGAIAGLAPQQVREQLAPAQEMGLVARSAGSYRFMHDKIQEAAYALLAEDQRAATHLRIARRLRQAGALPGQGRDSLFFDRVNQYLRGDALVETDEERLEVAQLYLQAARDAIGDSAYAAALQYLARGQALLPADVWQRDYRLGFALARAHAECTFYAGEPAAADALLQDLARHAQGLVDRALLTALQITVCLALDDSARAIATCLAFLRDVDAPWPPHPSRAEVQQEFLGLQARLAGRSVASLAELPPMQDPLRRAMLDVLAAVLPPAFFSDENLVCLVLCRMVNLSIDHGNTDASPLAYAYLGMMAGPYFRDYRLAFELGQLGHALVERGEYSFYRARVVMCFAYHVLPWTRGLHDTLALLRGAFRITRETGDVTYSGFASCTLVSSMLFAGPALDLIEAEGAQRLELMRAARFGLIVDIMRAQLRLVATLQGRSDRLGSFDGPDFSEARFESHLEANRSLDIAACWYWIRKAQARYLAGSHGEALQALARAQPLLWTSKGHLEIAEYHFFSGLAHAAAWDAAAGDLAASDAAAAPLRAQHRARLAEHLAQHAEWAAQAPASFAARHALLAAEAARLDGDAQAALTLYDDSAQLAHDAGMAQIEALALERAAGFHAGAGRKALALALRRSARDTWQAWGARGKALQLEDRHFELAPRPDTPRPAALDRPLGAMDVETLLRISQTLAAEKGLGPLVQSLMTMTLEHAGADRALLVLPRGEQLRIEARAQNLQGSVRFVLQSAAAGAADLPVSVLHYALRTRSPVLIDDARQPGAFAADRYLLQSGVRSVLCLPLMRRGEPLGALYLENSLTGQVFTADRVGVLALVASMAATSMENATLGEKESLLQEVHHRVKNNLQLISSLLSLQAARIAEPAVAELFAESRNRVRSMALVHENLYRAGNFARVPMATHLGKLCAQLGHVYGLDETRVRMRVQIDDIELGLGQAVSCGLILNELVSNALKHAFPGDARGVIDIAMLRTPDQQYELHVADDGIGLPDGVVLPNGATLGLQLVEDLSQQLRGRLSVQRGAGTRFCIQFAVEPDLQPQDSRA